MPNHTHIPVNLSLKGLQTLAKLKMFLHETDVTILHGGEVGVLSPAGRVTLYSSTGERLTKKSRKPA